jgi:hypothetical protein
LFGLIGPESINIPAFIFIEIIVRVISWWGVKTSCFDPQNLDGRQPWRTVAFFPPWLTS